MANNLVSWFEIYVQDLDDSLLPACHDLERRYQHLLLFLLGLVALLCSPVPNRGQDPKENIVRVNNMKMQEVPVVK
jgi:hypothetical protein